MTELQSKCLAFIRGFIVGHGFSPSYNEIGAHMGLSSRSSVSRLVFCLRDHGHITVKPYRRRSIQLVETKDMVHIGVLAQRVLDSIIIDEPETGVVMVSSKAIGELDIALNGGTA